MARALGEFQREFKQLKVAISTRVNQMAQYDNNLALQMEKLTSGFTALGVQLKALALKGVQHSTIEPYLKDPQVARLVKELSDTREMGKYASVEANKVKPELIPLEDRVKELQEELTQAIGQRESKVISKVLRLNQNGMRALLAEMTKYLRADPDYIRIPLFRDQPKTPDSFDRVYKFSLNKALTTDLKTVQMSDQVERWMQSMSLRIVKSNQNKARTAFLAIQKASAEAAAAVKAGNKVTLARAQKDAKLAHLKLKEVTDPYVAAMKNDTVKMFLNSAKGDEKKQVQVLLDYPVHAGKELSKLVKLKV